MRGALSLPVHVREHTMVLFDACSAHDLDALFADADARWRAVEGRDPRADGRFVYAVTTTGIYCRPVCRARRPHPRNVRFRDTCDDAERDGYRACKLCRPRSAACHELGREFAVRPAAILFVDIKGFTGLTSAMKPGPAFQLIRDFQTILGRVVRSHGGEVHKQLGDGFMAIFGADRSGADDAARAIETALGMTAALARWNAVRSKNNQVPIDLGIGIDYGMVAFGLVGGEPAVIGTTVNVASRLERYTRRSGAQLAVSGRAIAALPVGDRFLVGQLLDAGRVRLPGCGPLEVWREIDAAASQGSVGPAAEVA